MPGADDFRSCFRTEFFPLHSDAVVTNTLEGTSYFQGRRTVDDYLDDFQDLISDSGYSDLKTIVVKFRRGLGCDWTVHRPQIRKVKSDPHNQTASTDTCL